MRRALCAAVFVLAAFAAPQASAQDAGVAAPAAADAGAPTRPRRRDAGPRVRPAPRRMDAGTPIEAGADAVDGGAGTMAADAALDGGVLDSSADAATGSGDGGPQADAAPRLSDADASSGAAVERDAGTDAGTSPAVQPEPTPARSQDVPWTTLLNELLFERAAREQRQRPAPEARPAAGPLTPTTVVNTPRDVDVNIVGCSARPELLGLGLPERRVSTFGLLLLLVLALLGVALVERLRRPLPERGLLPRALGAANMTVRLAVVVILMMLVSRLLPAWLRPALLLTIAAVAITVGFGAVWVVLPDVVAGIILLTERRLRPGLYLSGDGFRGTLENVSPRVTTLRAPDGSTLTVPNRTLVRSRIRSSDRRWHELKVELTAPAGFAAPRVRRAIEDAVLSSPHIPPSPALVVSRDPAHPDRWRVKTRLIDTRFVPDFEGQLLERVEEALAADRDDNDTNDERGSDARGTDADSTDANSTEADDT